MGAWKALPTFSTYALPSFVLPSAAQSATSANINITCSYIDGGVDEADFIFYIPTGDAGEMTFTLDGNPLGAPNFTFTQQIS